MSMPVLQSKRKSRREESKILTGTPYKKKLANKKISKKTKSRKKLNYQKKRLNLNEEKTTNATETLKIQKKLATLDSQCIVCNKWWHDSTSGKIWIQCSRCRVATRTL